MPGKVVIINGNNVHFECSKIAHIRSRGSMVNQLIKAYGLLKYAEVIEGNCATDDDLMSFHSKDYIDYLKTINDNDDLEKAERENEFGLGYDCPALKNLYTFATAVVGASLSAADELISGRAFAAINWYGGWHHAQRDEAEGFCYVNDIVCAIERLRTKFKKVLYIDLDIHHGNGVQNAYEFTSKIMTLSFHQYEPGFYPGTGSLDDVGKGTGRFYSVNVPLKSGIRDGPYYSVFSSVSEAVVRAFRPDVIVVQCGADGLNEDPLGSFNLTLNGIGSCVKRILSWNIPVLFLGGGGYNLPNVARCWTYLTSIIVGRELSSAANIPDNSFFPRYGPGFDLHISRGNRSDENSKEYLEKITQTVIDNMKNIAGFDPHINRGNRSDGISKEYLETLTETVIDNMKNIEMI